ncbi:MAG TPA: hypothetical protein P5306_08655 [Kiritimatiellia bacterium]|nr:hypothetical protein [Kiritimatiellia bacterium]
MDRPAENHLQERIPDSTVEPVGKEAEEPGPEDAVFVVGPDQVRGVQMAVLEGVVEFGGFGLPLVPIRDPMAVVPDQVQPRAEQQQEESKQDETGKMIRMVHGSVERDSR